MFQEFRKGIIMFLRKIYLLFVSAVVFYGNLTAGSDFVQQGKAAIKKKDLKTAISSFWLAAGEGNREAVNYLSAIYTVNNGFDKETFQKYVPAVTEKIFPLYQAAVFSNRFVLIAPEKAIQDKVFADIKSAISNRRILLKTTKWAAALHFSWLSAIALWTGDDILERYIFSTVNEETEKDNILLNGISAFRKSLILKTAGGKLYARSKKIKDLGEIAIVDRETAVKYFNFSHFPEMEWSLYVRSPDDEDYLIPFAKFHETVRKRKINAFIQLCGYLGATQGIASSETVHRENISQEYNASGEYQSSGKAKVQVNIDTKSKQQELTKYNFKFRGSSTVYRVEGYWLANDDDFKLMYKRRFDLDNPMLEGDVVIRFSNDYSVNVATKTALENAKLNVDLGTHHQFQKNQEYVICYRVLFPPAEIISEEVKKLK